MHDSVNYDVNSGSLFTLKAFCVNNDDGYLRKRKQLWAQSADGLIYKTTFL